ncbi:hypothetical protein [Actinopolyspora lacussalsi]|uniref:hypothetical protein n=1 Tax=Actinopolyspora righensis TaxID=995060 RepID=UPI000B87F602|nr:hypothetical protein [Actinopolyspora righensis]
MVTGHDARVKLLERNKRPAVPLRHTFVQRPSEETPRHGPLCEFVRNGDLRGLRAYLVVVAASGGERAEDGWTTELDSMVWARLFDTDQHTGPRGARAAAQRILDRLQDRGLIHRARSARGSRQIAVTLLREDGSGKPYDRPDGGDTADRFLRLPVVFWNERFDARLSLPAMTMLLVLLKERRWSAFPPDKMPDWYGISADTTQRGLKELNELGLVERRTRYKEAPLTPTGTTMLHQYALLGEMRPPKPGKRPIRQRDA